MARCTEAEGEERVNMSRLCAVIFPLSVSDLPSCLTSSAEALNIMRESDRLVLHTVGLLL